MDRNNGNNDNDNNIANNASPTSATNEEVTIGAISVIPSQSPRASAASATTPQNGGDMESVVSEPGPQARREKARRTNQAGDLVSPVAAAGRQVSKGAFSRMTSPGAYASGNSGEMSRQDRSSPFSPSASKSGAVPQLPYGSSLASNQNADRTSEALYRKILLEDEQTTITGDDGAGTNSRGDTIPSSAAGSKPISSQMVESQGHSNSDLLHMSFDSRPPSAKAGRQDSQIGAFQASPTPNSFDAHEAERLDGGVFDPLVRDVSTERDDTKPKKVLPQAVLLQADPVTPDGEMQKDVTDAERQKIREEAEENARKKVEGTVVHATMAEDVIDINATSSDKQRSKSIIICVVCLILIGVIVGIVVGVQSNSSDSSSSATNPTDNGGSGGATSPPTKSPVETMPPTTMPPTFFPIIDTDAPCTSNSFCECALDINETDIGEFLFGSTAGATTDAVSTCGGISRNGAGVWYRMKSSSFTDANGTTPTDVNTPAPRIFMASLCASPPSEQGTDYDSQISIFAGDRCDRLQCVAGNDQGGVECNDKSRASFVLNGNVDESYYIYVHGFRSSRGHFAMEVSELPSSSRCEDAVFVPASTDSVISSTKSGIVQPPEVGDCGSAVSTAPGVWLELAFAPFFIDLGFAAYVIATPITDGFIPQVSLFEGGSCDESQCISGRVGIASVVPNSDDRYFALVHGVGNTVGDFVLSIQAFPSANEDKKAPFAVFCASPIGLPIGSNISTTLDGLVPEVDPVVSCGNDVLIDTRGSFFDAYRGRWFNTTGTGSILRASTCNANTKINTKISVFTGTCGDLQCIDANDDASTFLRAENDEDSENEFCSVLEWYAHEGVEYKLIVHTPEDRSPNKFDCTITLREVDPSSNQTCQTATAIPTDGTTTIGVLHPTIKTVEEMPPTIPIISDDTHIVTESDDHDEYLFWYSVKGTGQPLTASTCHPGSMLLQTSTSTSTSTSIFIFANDGNTASCDNLRQLIDVTSASPSPEFLVKTPCNNHTSATWKTTFDQEYFVVVKLAVENTAAVAGAASVGTDTVGSDIDSDAQQVTMNTDSDTDSDTTTLHPTFTLTVEDAAVNDKCRSAIGPLPLDGKYRTITTRSATRSFISVKGDRTIQDYPSCPSTTSSDTDAEGRDVWFSFIGNGMDLIASTCSIYTQFNTQVTMYRGDECTSLSCAANVDDSVGSTDAVPSIGMEMNCSDVFLSVNRDFNEIAQGRGRSIRWTSEVDVLYFIRVSGRDLDEDYGVVDFRISPYNDICSRAISLELVTSGSSAVAVGRITGTSEGALEYGGCDAPPQTRGTGGVWYKVKGTGGPMYASTCNTAGRLPTYVSISEINFDHYGSVIVDNIDTDPNFPVIIIVDEPYPRTRAVDEDTFSCDVLQCVDTEREDGSSTITACGSHHQVLWNSTASVTYYMMVQSLGGEFDLEVGSMA